MYIKEVIAMKSSSLLLTVMVAVALARCGGESATSDGDADAVPDVVFEDLLDVVPDDAADLPGDDVSDTRPDETADPVDDTPSDGPDCPSPPTCDAPLVRGVENALDESGCPTGYCCTGIEVVLEEVTVMSRLTLDLRGSGTVRNIGEVAVVYAELDCEILNPVDDSLVVSCEPVTLVSDPSLDVDQSSTFDLAPDCIIHGPEPCFDPVDVVCTFTWETIGCYSSGEAEATATVDFICGV
jgi:hypothetical protein